MPWISSWHFVYRSIFKSHNPTSSLLDTIKCVYHISCCYYREQKFYHILDFKRLCGHISWEHLPFYKPQGNKKILKLRKWWLFNGKSFLLFWKINTHDKKDMQKSVKKGWKKGFYFVFSFVCYYVQLAPWWPWSTDKTAL